MEFATATILTLLDQLVTPCLVVAMLHSPQSAVRVSSTVALAMLMSINLLQLKQGLVYVILLSPLSADLVNVLHLTQMSAAFVAAMLLRLLAPEPAPVLPQLLPMPLGTVCVLLLPFFSQAVASARHLG